MRKIRVKHIFLSDLNPGEEVIMYVLKDDFEDTGLKRSLRTPFFNMMRTLKEDKDLFKGFVLQHNGRFSLVDKINSLIEEL
jgi:hypothetical protein